MGEHDHEVGIQWEASLESNFRGRAKPFCGDDKLPDSKADPITLNVASESLSVDIPSQFDLHVVQMRLAGTTEPTTPSM